MNLIISLICIIFGIVIIACGGYGAWEMLVNGIFNCVEGAKANPTESLRIAKGVAMIIFCEIPLLIGLIIGMVFMKAGAGK